MRITARLARRLIISCGVAAAFTACASSTPRSSPTAGPGSSAATTTAGTSAGATPTNDIVPPGDIPDNQAYVPYASPTGRFVVSYPEGWSQRTVSSTTTFTDKFNSMTIATASGKAPTLASERAVVVPLLQAANKQFELRSIDAVRRPAGPAVRVTYRAVSGVDPVTAKTILLDVERYDFFRNGMIVTITLASPKGSDNVDPWSTITRSLHWT